MNRKETITSVMLQFQTSCRLVPLFVAKQGLLRSLMDNMRRTCALVCLLLFATVSTRAAVITFSSPAELNAWTFSNGHEFPGAKGSFEWGQANGIGFAELKYDFRPPEHATEKFNPSYVMATRNLTAAEGQHINQIRFLTRTSNNLLQFLVRIKDSAGQTFQFEPIPTLDPVPDGGQGMTESCIVLKPGKKSWGGPADGIMRPPFVSLGVIVSATGLRDTGSLRLGAINLSYVDPETPVELIPSQFNTPPGELANLNERTGVSIQFLRDNRALDLIAGAGFTYIRMVLDWNRVESSANTYNFSSFDKLVAAAESRGLKTLAVLGFGNSIYMDDRMQPPLTAEQNAAFANFAREAVTHYKGRPVLFEIWNEPDAPRFWRKKPDASQFNTTLSTALTAAREADATATILTAGLSYPGPATYKFWDLLVRTGAMNGASGLGTHLYVDDSPEIRWRDIQIIKQIAQAGLPGKQVWCTEWGFSSTKLSETKDGRDPAARDMQANRTIRQMLLTWWADLPMDILYDLKDDGRDPFSSEANYGLLTADYSEKPAFIAAKTLISLSSGKKFTGMMKSAALPAGAYVARLEDSASIIYVAWCDERLSSFVVASPDPKARVLSMTGQLIPLRQDEAKAIIPVSLRKGPVFIEVPQT